MNWLFGQSESRPWRLVMVVYLTNEGYISLPLCIFVLDKKGEKKVLTSRRPWKLNKHACKWEVIWMRICRCWQEEQHNLWLYFFSFFSYFLPLFFFLLFPSPLPYPPRPARPAEIFSKARVYFQITLLLQNGEMTFSFSREASWLASVGLEPSVP